MNWSNPYLWFCMTTGTILVVLLVIRKCRPLYRFVTTVLLCFSLYLFFVKSPKEGADDFRTADTVRIIMTDHRLLANYKQETNRYPPSGAEGLDELSRYISGFVYLADAWNRDLMYEIVDGVPRITSAGADGRFGTSDDIVR